MSNCEYSFTAYSEIIVDKLKKPYLRPLMPLLSGLIAIYFEYSNCI
jgi:hypothetical protein